jgi:hypothetical protein
VPISTVSSIDIPSLVELGFENLLASRDLLTRQTAEEATAEFLTQAAYFDEPWTRQKLPYDSGGMGIDLVAAHAFLMQAVTSTMQASSEENSLLTSVNWRRDWYSWRIWVPDLARSRRAAALAVLAGAVCPEPERRLDSAMLQCGLAAQRGLGIWRFRRGLEPKEPALLEPMDKFRKTLFYMDNAMKDEDPFAHSLLSEIRVYGDTPVQLLNSNEGTCLVWNVTSSEPGTLVFASTTPPQFAPHESASISLVEALGFVELKFVPKEAGPVRAWMTLIKGRTLPAVVAPPTYSELER